MAKRDLYLVTGFLGAGKTTFLKNFIRLFAGRKIQLIINEFGKEGMDGELLKDLGAYLQEISGGSVFCACRIDQFEKTLRDTAGLDVDVILVEASGLSDPTGVRKLFAQTDRFPNIAYRGSVCLIDAVRFPKEYATARTCVRQLAVGDVGVLNKTDRATEAQKAETLALVKGQRPDMPLIETSFGQVDSTILDLMETAVHRPEEDALLLEDLSVRRIMVRVAPTISAYELEKFIQMFAEFTFRVKGFVQTADGVYLADCVGSVVDVRPWLAPVPAEKLGWLNVLSGTKMPTRKALKEAAQWYEGKVLEIQ